MTTPVPGPARREPARLVQAWVLAIGGPALLVGLLLPARDSDPLAAVLVALLAVVVLAGQLGGQMPASAAAVLGLLLAAGFLRPVGSQLFDRPWDVLALVGFAGIAGWVIRIVDRAGRPVTTPASTAPAASERSDTLAG